MNKTFDPELPDEENPEWTDEMFASAVRVGKLPASLQEKINRGGRPVAENPKISTTIRLSPEVIAYFKADGKGWQTRIDAALREYIATQ